MPYTPANGNVVDFTFSSAGYVPPAGGAVNFAFIDTAAKLFSALKIKAGLTTAVMLSARSRFKVSLKSTIGQPTLALRGRIFTKESSTSALRAAVRISARETSMSKGRTGPSFVIHIKSKLLTSLFLLLGPIGGRLAFSWHSKLQLTTITRFAPSAVLSARTQSTLTLKLAPKLYPKLHDQRRYIAKLDPCLDYIVSRYARTPMPSAPPLPPIDAIVQFQTITLDFGFGPYLPEGVTLTGTPVVSLEVEFGEDPAPASRIIITPQIGTAPLPYGSGRQNCAILFQVGICPVGVRYKILAQCPRTDNDVATMDVVLPVRDPTAKS